MVKRLVILIFVLANYISNGQITANFTTGSTCEFSDVNFSDLSNDSSADSIINTVWDFDNDGFFDDGSGISVSNLYNGSGNFTIGVKVYSSSGDSAQFYNTINISPIPIADFTSTNTCVGDSLTLTDASNANGTTIAKYEWFSNGVSSKANVAKERFMNNSDGLQTMRLEITTSAGCLASSEKDVDINPIPLSDFSFNTPCLGDSMVLEATSTISNGSISNNDWDLNNDLNFSDYSGNDHKLLNTAAGNITIRLRSTSQKGCASETFKVINISPAPYVNFTVQDACENQDIKLINLSFDNVGPMNFEWKFNDGTSNSTEEEPTKKFTTAGTKTIELIGTNLYNCKDSIERTIQVSAVPVANFSYQDVCDGESIDFSFTGSGNTKNTIWDFNDGSGNVGENLTHTYSDSGEYQVSLIAVNLDNCYDTISQSVTVWEKPSNTISSTENFEFCEGDGITLTAEETTHNILWNTGSTNPKIYVTEGKTYTLVTYTSHGCQGIEEAYVTEHKKPQLDAGSDTIVSLGESATLTATGNFESIEWFQVGEDNVLSNNNTLKVSPSISTFYYCEGQNDFGCPNTDTVLVRVLKDYKLDISNVLTPNQDGKNDQWFIENVNSYSECIVTIYNRWGKEVYTKQNYQNDWEGKDLNGNELPEGTYYYVVSCKEINHTWEGAITLLRLKE